MHTFYVIWNYMGTCGNLIEVEAETCAEAREVATADCDEHFHTHATVFVFYDAPAVFGAGAPDAD